VPDAPVRLLFDENLSRRLVGALADVFPGSRHVAAEGLASADDLAVWDHAARSDLVIVTKDADFHQRSFLLGAPPKVVWVRLGNCTTDDVHGLLRVRAAAIVAFVRDADAAFLELS
jgi:predicted nuclease of predicted toxin-antitoxin system